MEVSILHVFKGKCPLCRDLAMPCWLGLGLCTYVYRLGLRLQVFHLVRLRVMCVYIHSWGVLSIMLGFNRKMPKATLMWYWVGMLVCTLAFVLVGSLSRKIVLFRLFKGTLMDMFFGTGTSMGVSFDVLLGPWWCTCKKQLLLTTTNLKLSSNQI